MNEENECGAAVTGSESHRRGSPGTGPVKGQSYGGFVKDVIVGATPQECFAVIEPDDGDVFGYKPNGHKETVTFTFTNKDVWKESHEPQRKEEVVFSDIIRTGGGWRTMNPEPKRTAE